MNGENPPVRTLWHSVDGGRTWTECQVLRGAPLDGGVVHPLDGWWDDGAGNLYRNEPPPGGRIAARHGFTSP